MSAEDQPRDHVSVDEETPANNSDIEENIKSRSTWIRFFFMLIVFAIYFVSRPIVFAVIVLQFFWVLLTAETNKQLAAFGHSLALYTCQIIDFLTYNSETKPYPFDSGWPSAD